MIDLTPIGTASDHLDGLTESPFAPLYDEDRVRRETARDPFPLPPVDVREGYHRENHLNYWLSGLHDCERAMEHWQGQAPPRRVLEFGSSSGRVLRHFAWQYPDTTCYGCDLGRDSTQWMSENLGPNVVPFQNTTHPALPLADGSVDLIVAYSVFTHIDTLELAWLCELGRIVSPGGLLFLTVMDEYGWDQTMKQDWRYESALKYSVGFDKLERHSPIPGNGKVFFPSPGGSYGNAFHRRDYIERVWSRVFDVVTITDPPPRAKRGIQSGVVLRPKARPA